MAIMVCASMTFAKNNNKKQNHCCNNSKPQTECCQANRACNFEGLNLSEAQQTQLKDLCTKQCNNKADKKAAKKAARTAAKKETLARIKGILTPEQYIQYLENSYLHGKKAAMGGNHNNAKHRKHYGRKH